MRPVTRWERIVGDLVVVLVVVGLALWLAIR